MMQRLAWAGVFVAGLIGMIPGCIDTGGDDGSSGGDISGATVVGNIASPTGAGTTISVDGKSDTTGSDGYFAISGVAAGTKSVHFSANTGSGSVSMSIPDGGTLHVKDVKIAGGRVDVGSYEVLGSDSAGGAAPPATPPTTGSTSGGSTGSGSGGTTTPTSQYTLSNVRASGFYTVSFRHTGLGSWPTTRLSNGKVICGWIQVNNKNVDKIGPSNTSKTLRNTQRGSQYYQPIAKGQTVSIRLISLDGTKKTNPVSFVWPWAGTDEVSFH